MNLKIIGQLAGVAVLTAGLAGCMDITSEIEILSETNARVTTTTVIAAELYADSSGGESTFCKEEGAVLTENEDGSATCVEVVEGTFAEIQEAGAEASGSGSYEVVSPGVVKVSFSAAELRGEASGGDGEEADEQTKAMMAAFFDGHSATLRVKGQEILTTNMTVVDDGTAAELVVPFTDLINGTDSLPETLFATVRVD